MGVRLVSMTVGYPNPAPRVPNADNQLTDAEVNSTIIGPDANVWLAANETDRIAEDAKVYPPIDGRQTRNVGMITQFQQMTFARG